MNKNSLLMLCAATLLCALSVCSCKSEQDVTSDVANLQTTYDVDVQIGQTVKDTWNLVSYNVGYSQESVRRYLDLLSIQLSKYPKGYLRKAHAGTLVLTNDLAFNGQLRAAVPDPYKGVLYLSVNGAYGNGSFSYLDHVFHHELNHSVEYILWGSMTFQWREWEELNDPTFQYGVGGDTAYTNFEVDWQDLSHPRNGFINLYSTTAEWEERAEIVAAIMDDSMRVTLAKYIREDAIIKAKVEKIIQMLIQFWPEENKASWLEKEKKELSIGT
jgi:hypothetical protein